jgi:hypothetical protein
MSIVTLKKKSAVVNSKNHSNRDASLYWDGVYSTSGFSINGPLRNVGYVGKSYGFSKVFTPFKGELPVNSAGSAVGLASGSIVLSVSPSDYETKGQQNMYNKTSVVSTRGMLRGKYSWAYNGMFPRRWVQPDANNPEYASQSVYISGLSAKNNCVVDTNNTQKYIDNTGQCKSENRKRLDCANNYSKSLHIPVDSSVYTGRIQQKCADPTDAQKPFPYAVNNAGCNSYAYKP